MSTLQQSWHQLMEAEVKQNQRVWQQIERKPNEFKLGDTVWDLKGDSYLLVQKADKEKRLLSPATAKRMYLKHQIKKIAVDDTVETFATAFAKSELLVADMKTDIQYEIVADQEYSNATTLLSKKGKIVYVTYRGNEFEDNPFSFMFDISISKRIEGCEGLTIKTMDLSELEAFSVEVYQQVVCSSVIPSNFKSFVKELS
ncbi:MAG: hypothetical protein R3267_10845 [Paenisporosarcina sp.]|nr:hypothetical protein [Paenisporosarcina sp.]